jgi:hypothetical protein
VGRAAVVSERGGQGLTGPARDSAPIARLLPMPPANPDGTRITMPARDAGHDD